MRILITNDDGQFAAQLPGLIAWCKTLGEVTVAVPKGEQSGKSHSIELHVPFEVKRADRDGVEFYAVDSSPADCVRFAVMGLHKDFDLVVSGVNRGFNMGTDIMYSGTVGAVFEAANLNIPAIALSTNPGNYDHATEELDRVWRFMEENGLWKLHSHYNVNIPASPKGIQIARQGGPFYSDRFEPVGNDLYQPSGFLVYKSREDMTVDADAVTAGYISIMPLTIDRCESRVYEELKHLNTIKQTSPGLVPYKKT